MVKKLQVLLREWHGRHMFGIAYHIQGLHWSFNLLVDQIYSGIGKTCQVVLEGSSLACVVEDR